VYAASENRSLDHQRYIRVQCIIFLKTRLADTKTELTVRSVKEGRQEIRMLLQAINRAMPQSVRINN